MARHSEIIDQRDHNGPDAAASEPEEGQETSHASEDALPGEKGEGHLPIVEPTARFEPVKIPLRESAHGLDSISGVLGVPEWWPTGSRVAVVIAHGGTSDMNDPLIEQLHRSLTDLKYLTLRFNFPFAEQGRRSSSDSPLVLEQAFRAAIAILGREPGAAPAHLFLGGKGLGARVAAQVTAGGVRPDGLFFLGFPLHPQDKPEQVHAEHLFRVVSPMLFMQGTRDRQCEMRVLRRTLARIGAPTKLWVADDADRDFAVPKKSAVSSEQLRATLIKTTEDWISEVLGDR